MRSKREIRSKLQGLRDFSATAEPERGGILMRKAALALLLASQLRGAEHHHRDHLRRWWLCSVAAVAAGSTADGVSSWHLHELNPILRDSSGRFGAKAVSLKFVIGGGTVLVEWLVRRDTLAAKLDTLMNFGTSAMYGVTAYKNEQIPRDPSPVRGRR